MGRVNIATNKNKQIFDDLADWFSKNQPTMLLQICDQPLQLKYGYSINNGEIFAKGKYVLYSPDHNAYGYEIVILFPSDYPNSYPSIVCNDDNLPPSLHRHILPGGLACLGLVTDLNSIWSKKAVFDNFACNVISPFIAWQLHYDTFGSPPPWGERSHGILGYIEFFADLISKHQKLDHRIIQLLIIQKPVPKKRRKCPCGKKKQFRYCHGRFIYPIRKLFHEFCNQPPNKVKMTTMDFVLKTYEIIIARMKSDLNVKNKNAKKHNKQYGFD